MGISVEPNVIEVDDVLRGYNSFDKLSEIYSRIREEVLILEPIQVSQNGLVCIRDTSHRDGSYELEIYNLEGGIAVIEAWGSWKGYANESTRQPRIREVREGLGFGNLRITLHGGANKRSKDIEGIIADFPSKSPKGGIVV